MLYSILLYGKLLDLAKTNCVCLRKSVTGAAEMDNHKTGYCGWHGQGGKGPTRPLPCTKNYRQLRNAESGGNSLPQGRVQQLVLHFQKVNLKTHYNIVQIAQVVFMDLGIMFKREYKAIRDCCSCRTLVFPGHTHGSLQ